MSDTTKMWVGLAGTIPFWILLGVVIGLLSAR
jgi:hypothetical protein